MTIRDPTPGNETATKYAWTPEPMDTRASLKGLDLPEAQMDLDLLVVSICPLIYKIEINIIN